MEETLKQKLKEYLDVGKSYQEATNLLLAQGFTQLQIEDAKITLDSQANSQDKSKLDISAHPELASSLLESAESMAKSKEHESSETNAMFTTNISGLVYSAKVKGNIYWLFIWALVILIVLFLLAKYILK